MHLAKGVAPSENKLVIVLPASDLFRRAAGTSILFKKHFHAMRFQRGVFWCEPANATGLPSKVNVFTGTGIPSLSFTGFAD